MLLNYRTIRQQMPPLFYLQIANICITAKSFERLCYAERTKGDKFIHC